MTLNDVLAALSNNEMLCIEIIETVEETDNIIIEFDAPGYEALSTELLARTVSDIIINTQASIVAGVKIKVV